MKETKSLPDMVELAHRISQDPRAFPLYSLKGGLIIKEGRIVLSSYSKLKETLLREYHSYLQDGHTGVSKTLSRITEGFWWQGIRGDVNKFVQECKTCQYMKYETKAPGGYYNQFPHQREFGKISPLTLSWDYLYPKEAL